MRERAIAAALRLYPGGWRDVHGDELAQLTEDLLDDPRERPWRIVASVTVGALREQVRPRYLGAGRLAGLGLTGVVLAATGLGLTYLVGQGRVLDLIPASAPSSGRLTTFAGMQSVLSRQHVRVVVDGSVIPLPLIAGTSVGFEQTTAVDFQRVVAKIPVLTGPSLSAQAAQAPPAYRFSPIVSVKRAVAYQVLSVLLARRAEHDGRVVSLSAARAFAEKEYAAWRRDPVRLLHGDGRPAFLSALAVAGYRQELTLDRELTAIGGPSVGDRTPALRRWMNSQLPENSVVIDGVPGLTGADLGANLPPHL